MRSQPLKPWCRRVGPVTFLVFLTGHVWDPTAAVPPLRAVITDVDGTLMAFATSSRISQRNRKALLAAKEVGCEVMVATGRIPGPWYDALQAEMPEVLGAGVFCNGALILKDHEVLHESVLPKSAVAKIVDCLPAGRVGLKGPRLGALAVIGSHEDGSHHYSELTSDGATWVTSLIQRAGEPVSITTSWKSLLEMKVHKFVMFTDTEKNWAPMDEVVAMLQEKLQRTGVTVLDCGSKQCEILPPGVNKGTGVQRLLSILNIDTTAAIACGDGVNDIEMLQLVAKGVAMGDAHPLAQAAADVVVAAHNNDGVAEAIERYVL